tara:strand:+ start:378 stop:1025 length:648 start_codon:yes stop_codon:yes gene_type:complete
MKIQILISKSSWANVYRVFIKKKLRPYSKKILFLNNHKNLKKNYDVNIIFSYFKKIKKNFLKLSKNNLILHESNLPKGRGMSPISWQIIEGKKNIIFSLIEASEKIDAGKIYYQKKVKFNGTELFEEIKKSQLINNLQLIEKFLKYKIKLNKTPKFKIQKGKPTYYSQRKPSDSKIKINKSIKSQINLLRVCDYKNYPPFFYYKKKKFLIKLTKK